jgi:hypothetical protein
MGHSRREVYFKLLAVFLDPDNFWPEIDRFTNQPPRPDTKETRKLRKIIDNAYGQYFRRIVFHDPHLFVMALDKVSFKDLVMDDAFGWDHVQSIIRMLGQRLGFGLTWWKDSLTEAIFIKDSAEASANMGSLGELYLMLTESSPALAYPTTRESFQGFGRLDLQQFTRCTRSQ